MFMCVACLNAAYFWAKCKTQENAKQKKNKRIYTAKRKRKLQNNKIKFACHTHARSSACVGQEKFQTNTDTKHV